MSEASLPLTKSQKKVMDQMRAGAVLRQTLFKTQSTHAESWSLNNRIHVNLSTAQALVRNNWIVANPKRVFENDRAREIVYQIAGK